MRNLIQTAATIRNVFAIGQDAAVARATDKRYGKRSYLNSVSHSSPAHRWAFHHAITQRANECRRGLVRWLKSARLPLAADRLGAALVGMAMRQPVAPCVAGPRTVS